MLSKRFRHLSLSVLISGLCALPVAAQTFSFDAVTCLNHRTGEAVAGSMQNGAIECSALVTQQGDRIGVILGGVANDGGGNPTECQEVIEQEPNDEAFQDAGTLPVDGCISLSGTTQTGYGDPNNPTPGFDQDNYLIATTGVTSVQLSAETDMPLNIAVYNPQTGEDIVCNGDTCPIPAGLSAVGVWIASQDAATYRVQVKAGSTGAPGSTGASITANPMQLNSGLRSHLR